MTTFIYRCPNTGQEVQGLTDDPPVADDPEAYQSVKCIACSRLHWVNPRTGRVLEPIGKHSSPEGSWAMVLSTENYRAHQQSPSNLNRSSTLPTLERCAADKDPISVRVRG